MTNTHTRLLYLPKGLYYVIDKNWQYVWSTHNIHVVARQPRPCLTSMLI